MWTSADNLGDVSTDGHIYSNVTSFLATNQQLQLLRFPGGLLANCYDWTKGIGSQASRPSGEPTFDFGTGKCVASAQVNHFGTDEFFNAGYQTNAAFSALITINICSIATNQVGTACAGSFPSPGTQLCPNPLLYPTAPGACPGADLAANWVEYLNGTDPANTWVQQRKTNDPSHPGPYGVRYFELGNEVFGQATLSASTYVSIAQAFRAAMRAVDSSIMIGGVLDPGQPPDSWDDTVATSGVFDFLIAHVYGGSGMWGGGISPRYTGLRTAPAGTSLPPGYTRNQRYQFSTSTTGGYELDVYAFALGGTAQMTLTVDGDTAHSVTRPVAAGSDATAYQFTSWTTTTSSHILTVQYAPSPSNGSTVLYLSGGRVCSPVPSPPGCAVNTAPNLDTSVADDDPSAIVPLYNGGAFARSLNIPQGATQLQVQAYGTPSGLACPSIYVTLDGQYVTQASLSNSFGGLGSACYTVFTPDVISAPLPPGTSPGAHTITVVASGNGTDADIVQVGALASGTLVSTVDLTPNPIGPQGFLQDLYYTTVSQSIPYLDGIAKYHLPVIVSQWSASMGNNAAVEPERENLESMLWDAGLLQSFVRHAVAGATFYSLDASGWGGGFRLFHCLSTALEEYGGACAPTALQPYLSVPGQMLSMLRQRLDASWLSPTVSAPTITTSWLLDADWAVIAGGDQQISELQALATRAAGQLDLQLINIADHAVSTQITIAGTTPTGTATLTSLSGSPFAIDGCDQDSLRPANAYNCNPSAVVPSSTQVTSASTMTITLPSDSFSVLSVPTST